MARLGKQIEIAHPGCEHHVEKVEVQVIGLGYVGLPIACSLASAGKLVRGVDIDPVVISKLSSGGLHIEEPGFEKLFRRAKAQINFSGVQGPAEVHIICVPTPLDSDNRMADLSSLKDACSSLGPHLRGGDLIIIESTVPVGTCDTVVTQILASSSDLDPYSDIDIAHVPERVLPGKLISELIHNDRVIGGLNLRSSERAADVYSAFVEGELHLTDSRTAEMVKLIENAARDVEIALINEFAMIADRIGVNIWDARSLANKHPRVNLLKPGPGVGGHCIPVDPWFLLENASLVSSLVREARLVNDSMPKYIFNMGQDLLQENRIEDPIICLLGLAYKANVGDTRESPAIVLQDLWQNSGAEVRFFDPHVKTSLSLQTALQDADLTVLVTDHDEFRNLDPGEVLRLMKRPLLVDARAAIDREIWESAGFIVKVIGDGGRKTGST